MSSMFSLSSFTSAESTSSLSSRSSTQGASPREEVGSLKEVSGSGVRGDRVDAATWLFRRSLRIISRAEQTMIGRVTKSLVSSLSITDRQ